MTPLFYLDDICVFAASINEMLDHIEMVFKRLEEFYLKIKQKKCHFFQHSVVFVGYVLSADNNLCKPWEKGWAKELAGANQPIGSTLIFGFGVLLLPVHT